MRILLLGLGCVLANAQAPVSFTKEIAPLLASKCTGCHAKAPVMAGLDLRTRESAIKGGQHGPAIVPGDAAASHLYRRLTGQEQPQMPFGGRLADSEIALVKKWIDSGAAWDGTLETKSESANAVFTERQKKYWAFQPVAKATVPAGAKPQRNPVDAFLHAKLAEKRMQPNPPADRVTLLRRASLDLTGLPPTPEEVQEFVSDRSATPFEKVVDRLLASPHYGERWGRHWLDLARYADSNGFKSDEPRPNIWRYRDYVIDAFNSDKPYDQFIREQIAGDELYPHDKNARIAVAFNRHFTEETNQPVIELRRQEILNDITDTVGSVFLGLTFGCARCHDHKFDPILHKDYYRLQAFFANIREDDHLNLLAGDPLQTYLRQRAVWEEKTKEIRTGMQALTTPVAKAKSDFYKIRFSEGTKVALAADLARRTPLQQLLAIKAMPQITYQERALARELKGEQKKQYAELEAELKKFDSLKPSEPPEAQTIIDHSSDAPKTHVLAAGAWDAPREEVQPGFLSILNPGNPKISPLPAINSTGRRTVLANWLADSKNPLPARVMVNRIWHYHFGRGIADSPSDLGMMGDRPSNQPLLDYLAATFQENGWSVKKMHRLIMLSDAYQRSSDGRAESSKADPDNKLLWRYDRHRLEGEAIRDSMLLASGRLNGKMGGPGVHPPLPPGTVPAKYGGWKAEEDPAEANRRSVYIFEKRIMVCPMFDAFDAPNPQESCARRFRTVIPSQSLMLMNDQLVLEWSQSLAARVLNDAGLSAAQQVDRAYRIALSRPPNEREREQVLAYMNEQTELIRERLGRNEKVPMPEKMPVGVAPERVAAFAGFCHVLLNSNEFLYMN